MTVQSDLGLARIKPCWPFCLRALARRAIGNRVTPRAEAAIVNVLHEVGPGAEIALPCPVAILGLLRPAKAFQASGKPA